LVSYALTPPPLPLHAVSEITAPLESRLRVVPPTPITFGELEGHITQAPLSPLDAKKAIPGALKYES